jgi:putative copper resistance protein D
MIVLAAMLFALGAGAWRRGSWLAVGVIVAGFVLGSLAWTGHALGAHPEHAFIAAIHILAAGLWIGMLVPLLWTLHRAVASVQHDFHRTAAAATRRFTLPGTVAVLALAASGALNAWWLVGSASALVSSGYGLLVTAKITVFVLMLALASTNRWVLLPRLRLDGTAETAAEPLRLLRVSVAFELAFGLSVLVLVGVLGITPPAAHEHANHPMHHTM